MNFERRKECFQCGLPRDGSGIPETKAQDDPNVRAGDWNCPDCGANNFSRRTFCFKCRRPQDSNEPFRGNQRNSEEFQGGDRFESHDNRRNFGNRNSEEFHGGDRFESHDNRRNFGDRNSEERFHGGNNQRNPGEFQGGDGFEPHDNRRNFGGQRPPPFGRDQPPNEAQYPQSSRQGPPQQQVNCFFKWGRLITADN